MEVANAVASIISALGNGKDLFRRMLGKKPKRRGPGRKPTLSEEEAWLRESLTRSPESIRTSLSQNISRHGRRFEVGDETASSSLGHILLVLNSGLMALIDKVLHGKDGKFDSAESNRVLRHLSENATRETLSAMSELSLRLAGDVPAPRVSSQEGPRRKKHKQRAETRDMKQPAIDSKKPVTAVRGAWVRPVKSSGSQSVASIASIATTTKATKKKAGQEPSSRHRHHRSQPNFHENPDASAHGKVHPRPAKPSPARPPEPSMLLVSSEIFLPKTAEHDYHDRNHAPQRRKHHHASRPPRPVSSATFMTASTKIGEIPPSRLLPTNTATPQAAVVDEPRLLQYLTDQDRIVLDLNSAPKKLKRGFKFWKRPQEEQELYNTAAVH
ncbi:uncharacterized protein AB675_7328 [Cyphellophora attinorum]|uniref:Uncharacterized protein n=1 Tax=Cyphellophora attinorum TaxID=1664694 RepID=A0A0N1HJ07_9EURO|nr:uncharacterized protein AB675_7328 [Phialophora attinorum]KPI36272.1 hypothetical protein AB675_7328 [Phialophora attinorum]